MYGPFIDLPAFSV